MEGGESKRIKWNSKMEFLFACLAFTVGSENILKFPYLAYANGGVVYAIPYCTMLFLCGMPLLYLELAVGQCVGYGPVKTIENMVPLMKGVGLSLVIIVLIIATYHSAILAWILNYFFASWKSDLPWMRCPVNATDCVNYHEYNSSMDFPGKLPNVYYLENEVLRMTDGLEDMGTINVKMLGYLALVWVICLLCLFRSIQVIGKLAYVTVTVTYIILFALFCRAVTLQGAYEGIQYYVLHDINALADPRIWFDASTQAFTSLGVGMGVLMTFSSHNHKSNNILADTLFISYINCVTSLCVGFIVFGLIGNHAYTMGLSVNAVATGGMRLSFGSMSTVLGSLPQAQFWCSIFYLMMFFVAFGTQLGFVEVLITTTKEWLHNSSCCARFEKWSAVLVCSVCFVLAIPNIMGGGWYYLGLLDYHVRIPYLAVIVFQILTFCHIFGIKKLSLMIRTVTKQTAMYGLLFCWKYISITIMVLVFVYNVVTYHPPVESHYWYPMWSVVVGWLLILVTLQFIPNYVYYRLFFWQVRSITTPFRQIFTDSISPKLGYLVEGMDSNQPKYPIQDQPREGAEVATTSHETTALMNINEAQNDLAPPEYNQVIGESNTAEPSAPPE